jgi:histidyl-tRNA synthetase
VPEADAASRSSGKGLAECRQPRIKHGSARRDAAAINDGVRRGIGYYTGDGFEAECASLGAQRQVAGGGRYAEGVGWAVGVDRLLLAKSSV